MVGSPSSHARACATHSSVDRQCLEGCVRITYSLFESTLSCTWLNEFLSLWSRIIIVNLGWCDSFSTLPLCFYGTAKYICCIQYDDRKRIIRSIGLHLLKVYPAHVLINVSLTLSACTGGIITVLTLCVCGCVTSLYNIHAVKNVYTTNWAYWLAFLLNFLLTIFSKKHFFQKLECCLLIFSFLALQSTR